jgi:circadian clock protein KaiC
MASTPLVVTRLKTGIAGLDALVEGGLVRGDVHVLAGGPGTGKTIFALNFAYNAIQSGERVVYATFEESAEYLKRNAKLLGMNFDPLEAEGKASILDLDALKGAQLETNISLLVRAAEESKSTILVIDSLTALLLACESSFELRTFVKSVYNALKEKKITTLMTVSTADAGSSIGIEGFLADSVMVLENWVDRMEFRTRFVILKMRGTNHSRKYHSVIFGPHLSISKF